MDSLVSAILAFIIVAQDGRWNFYNKVKDFDLQNSWTKHLKLFIRKTALSSA